MVKVLERLKRKLFERYPEGILIKGYHQTYNRVYEVPVSVDEDGRLLVRTEGLQIPEISMREIVPHFVAELIEVPEDIPKNLFKASSYGRRKEPLPEEIRRVGELIRKSITIIADDNNQDNVYIGYKKEDETLFINFPLSPGDSITIEMARLVDIYIVSWSPYTLRVYVIAGGGWYSETRC